MMIYHYYIEIQSKEMPMQYNVITGTDFDEKYLEKIMALDAIVYESEYVGVLENMVNRYRVNKKTFVCIENADTGELVGYINFFPTTDELYDSITNTSPVIRDDDIAPHEIAEYNNEANHLFILSIAINPAYQSDKDAVITLGNGWIDYLCRLQNEYNYPITDITATAVSHSGMKFLRNYMFIQTRKLTDGNIVYICKEKFLEKLLKKDLYFKSYKDDIYLLYPFADNPNNQKADALFNEKKHLMETGQIPDIPMALLEGINDCLNYECKSAVASDLETVYLDEFRLLHTTDDYAPAGEEIVVGEESAYAIITTHKPTRMYVLTLLIPNCEFSTTQVEDQMSYDYMKIADPKNPGCYIEIHEYMKRTYGLLECGDGKCLLCMSNKPKNHNEFQNIMAAEVYNSMHIDYRIHSKMVEEWCTTNYAQYDYYEVYLSDTVIAFILNDFLEDIFDRIAITATYAFIAELIMFQNTALAKTNIKISNVLANDNDISHEEILNLYHDFGKTVHFWEIKNYKYTGTQAEAACITKAFGNEELKQIYYEHQEFLDHIVELKAAQIESRNGNVINVVATFLAIIQIQSFIVEPLAAFYKNMGIEVIYADQTFNTLLVCGSLTFLLVWYILRRKKKRIHKRNISKR